MGGHTFNKLLGTSDYFFNKTPAPFPALRSNPKSEVHGISRCTGKVMLKNQSKTIELHLLLCFPKAQPVPYSL